MGRAVDDRIRATIRTGESVSDTPRYLSSDLDDQKTHALNLVSDAVVAVDPDGRITYLNCAAEELFGWTSLEVVGRVARTTLFAGTSSFDEAWRDVQDHGEWRGTIAQRAKSGVERQVEGHWSAVYEKESAKIGSILMISTEVLNVTAAGLAHEIRNPLAGIKGVADAFLERGQLTQQEREWMEAVRQEVMNIDARLREFLEPSSPLGFNVTQCLLSDAISRVVLLATHQLRSIDDRQITIEFIDTTTEPIVMPTDSSPIQDAVLNLVLNAIESIDENGRVSVYLRRKNSAHRNGEVLIEVADTGCGIPLDIREQIFEPLFTTKREGTGLGLAAVQRTAAAYHGRITFKTRIGRGSTFVLALPLRSRLDLTENPKWRLSLLF